MPSNVLPRRPLLTTTAALAGAALGFTVGNVVGSTVGRGVFPVRHMEALVLMTNSL